jgi:GTP-binding protein Era
MSYRAGLVALLGKPNVGKSTLLNAIVGQKVSIVSNKPQTTRRRICGIATTDEHQIVLVDTPGVHAPRTRLDRAMVDAARGALDAVDVAVIVVDGGHHPGEMDKEVAKWIENFEGPRLICINKMDTLAAENVAGFVEAFCALFKTTDYMLTTATRRNNVDKLIQLIVERLPEQPALYPEDEFTDQSSRFMAGELVREQILHETRQEIPYATAVTVDDWDEGGPTLRISASIVVEKASQRAIILGREGAMLKRIGTAAREGIETIMQRKAYLELHVRVQEGWRMNAAALHELEYGDL